MNGKHVTILVAAFVAGWIVNNLAFGQSAFTIKPTSS
jgi:hypothetical protein